MPSLLAQAFAIAFDKFEEEKHPRVSSGPNAGQFGKGSGTSEKNTNPEHKSASGNRGASSLQPAPSDPAQFPEHIKKLKLPPAWTDVRINPDPEADLQAVGKDAKGRPQYVYSSKFQQSQSAKKFARIQDLDAKFDKIRAENAQHVKSDDPKVKENAECAALVMAMGIRPGSETDTKAKVKAYGATTLEGKHVVVEGGKVRLKFTGKKGVPIDLEVPDPELAKTLAERAAKSGADGKLFPAVSDKSLLDYVHTLDGGKFKTKDMRTALASRLASSEVSKRPPAPPKNEKEYKARVMEVAKQVSSKLGNTPVVALQSYIPPALFSEWRASAGINAAA